MGITNMIKIDVYEKPENAKKVFQAYYNMIKKSIPFREKDIAEAVTHRFMSEYNYELGMKPEEVANNSEKDLTYEEYLENYPELKYIENYPELHKFLFPTDSTDLTKKLSIENLGMLLCGYMDEKNIKELRTNCFPKEERESSTSYFNDENGKEEQDQNKKKETLGQLLMKNVFRYKAMSEKKELVYKFVSTLNVQVCPYCNRNYISVVIDEESEDDKKKFKTRPPLDHFFSKSKYPFLAVSMRNLVPSCGVCNLEKHDNDNNILYPYKEGLGENYSFRIMTDKSIRYILGQNDVDFHIEIKENIARLSDIDSDYKKRVKESSETFVWALNYEFSKKYVLRVLKNRYYFNRTFQEDIVKGMPGIFSSVGEVQQLLNIKLRPQEEDNEEPLSKLTRDIYNSLELYDDI